MKKSRFLMLIIIFLSCLYPSFSKTYTLWQDGSNYVRCTQTFSDSNGDGILDTITNLYEWNLDIPGSILWLYPSLGCMNGQGSFTSITPFRILMNDPSTDVLSSVQTSLTANSYQSFEYSLPFSTFERMLKNENINSYDNPFYVDLKFSGISAKLITNNKITILKIIN